MTQQYPLMNLAGSPVGDVTPSAGSLLAMFTGIAGLPAQAQAILLERLMDAKGRQQLAEWSVSFADVMNKVKEHGIDKVRVLEPSIETDFLSLMKGTKYVGVRIGFDTLERVSNQMTKAMKAKNYLDAIRLGVALAGSLG
jgi:hypothetical protein